MASRATRDLAARQDEAERESMVPYLTYKCINIPFPFYETLPTVEQFQAEPGDVCVISYPKSGTTFMLAVLQMIQNNGNPAAMRDIPQLEFKTMDMKDSERPIDQIQQSLPPRLFFTHLTYNVLPKSITDKAKIVYIARNPKDSIVSRYNFLRAYIPRISHEYPHSLEDMAERYISGSTAYGPFYDHVGQHWQLPRSKSNVFFTTYERMIKDLPGAVRDLALFLEKSLSQEQLNNVVYHCGFDVMKDNAQVNKSAFAKEYLMDFTVSPFMRAGSGIYWSTAGVLVLVAGVAAFITAEFRKIYYDDSWWVLDDGALGKLLELRRISSSR